MDVSVKATENSGWIVWFIEVGALSISFYDFFSGSVEHALWWMLLAMYIAIYKNGKA